MSSHHFVKEDQEPALLFLNADSISFEKVQELLEWSPLVMVSHSSLDIVLSWGIKIDVLLMSRENDINQLAIDQAPLQIINSSADIHVLESVCRFLLDRKQINLNVIISKAQNTFTIAASFSKRINIVLFEDKFRWHLVENGSYSKWVPAQTILKVFDNGNHEEIIVLETGIYKIKRASAFWIGEEF